MAASKQESELYGKMLAPEVRNIFAKSFDTFTKVQIAAGDELLAHRDVVVESPTGSGKTLAFLLPMLTVMKSKRQKYGKDEVGAVILSPSRELATQISRVLEPYAEALKYKVFMAVGGQKLESNVKKFRSEGANIIIATPGRLAHILNSDNENTVRRALKTTEVLVVDEADRFNEKQFATDMVDIFSAIPKQRRTGLFSATQAKDRDDLVSFGLRNAKTIKLKESSNIVCPVALNNYYTICSAAEKLINVLEFIRSKPDKKLLVFFPSCAAVRYFRTMFVHLITKRKLYEVHGKCSQKQRTDQIGAYKKDTNGVMLSTDVMSRGIDIDDIDWVVQFEIPKLSSWFVHRAGRTGRSGREGNALLILTTEQEGYVQYVSKYEQVELKEISVPTSTPEKAELLRQKMIKLQANDRELLESGTRAFVSHIESYVKHDCNVVCGLKELDVSGLAHAYGILRLPKMRELKDRHDLDLFLRSDIDTSQIKYRNPELEKKRDTIMETKHNNKVEVLKKKRQEQREKEQRRFKTGAKTGRFARPPIDPKKAKADKRKKTREERDEKDDFEKDVRLLKQLKRGRLSQKEMRDVNF